MKRAILFLLITTYIFAACKNNGNRSHNHEDEHQHEVHDEDEHDEHEHKAVNFQLTQYNSNLELFIDQEPFIAGHTSKFLAHITKLADFKPLQKGAVTASLIVGGKEIRQKLEKPTRDGIYIFQLQPEITGKGKLVFDIQTADTTYLVTINNIEVFADEHEAMHKAEAAMTNSATATTFTKEQSWKVNFATTQPKTEPFGEVIKTVAHVQSAQGEEVILTAKTNGIITFKKSNLTEGMPVSPNHILCSISGEAFADNNPQVRLNEAKNNFEKAEADYKRKSELTKDKIVSEKELLDSKNEYENAAIIYRNLKKNFGKGGQNISRPINGFIKHIYISDKQYVEAGAPLLVISQNKNLYLKAEVQQKYAGSLPFVFSATIKTAENKIYSLEELNGKIISFSKNVSDESYLIPVTLQVENREGIVPGSFIEINLKTKSNKTALTVPNTALIEEQGNYFVFVQLTPEKFDKREVAIGNSDGIKTEILSGITGADRIVSRGAILVKLAAVSNSLDPHAGHIH
jgi:RND family efflux transporter MFP subunit